MDREGESEAELSTLSWGRGGKREIPNLLLLYPFFFLLFGGLHEMRARVALGLTISNEWS